jgi:hypothetical protein
MDVRQGTTCFSGAKEGNKNNKHFGSTGKRGKMVMRVLNG